MNTIANYITIASLPHYVKCSSYKNVLPELNCHWVNNINRSFPFIIAATGNIATPETFPYDKKNYRRTGKCYSFLRRANYRNGEYCGWYQLSFTFEILEKVTTGEQFAIIHDVERGDPVF